MKKRTGITVPPAKNSFDVCPDCQAHKIAGRDCNRSACPSRKARRRRAK